MFDARPCKRIETNIVSDIAAMTVRLCYAVPCKQYDNKNDPNYNEWQSIGMCIATQTPHKNLAGLNLNNKYYDKNDRAK